MKILAQVKQRKKKKKKKAQVLGSGVDEWSQHDNMKLFTFMVINKSDFVRSVHE